MAAPSSTAGHAPWLPLVAEVLGVPADQVAADLSASFIALGGTSLQAIGLVSLAQRRLGLDVPLARILAAGPLANALADATSYVASVAPQADPARGPVRHDLLPGQQAMLAAHVLGRDHPYHLMFTLEAPEPLEPDRIRDALRALAARHESLRTLFTPDGTTRGRLVLPAPHEPVLLHQTLPDDNDAVRAVHDQYGHRAAALLQPFDRPPMVFVHTRAGNRSLLTLLAHHVLVDGWGIGVLCADFAELYRHGPGPADDSPSPERIAARLRAADSSGLLARAMPRVAARLDGAPTVLSLPTDLPPLSEADMRGSRLVFHLSAAATQAAESLASRCRTTVTATVLAAWALAVGRRAGVADLVLGVPASGRFEAGMERIVGLCTRVVPVRCRTDQASTVADYVRATADALADAVADSDLPFESVVSGLGIEPDLRHNPLTQVGFAAHHELVPDTFTAGGTWRIHEGYCHGAVFNALLYLQSWSARPRLAIEYATAVLEPAGVGELAESFQAVLVELAGNPTEALATVTALSPAQLRRLRTMGGGSAFDTTDDIWRRVERHAAATPDALAISDVAAGVTLTYRQLRDHALAQATLLRRCGVRAGDRVVLELGRSAREAVAVLGVLRLAATYVAVDESATGQWRRHLAEVVRPRARIGDTVGDPLWSDVVECPVVDLRSTPDIGPDAPAPAGSSAAYVSFTSGSTGVPKGVVVPHSAVLRLADDPRMIVGRSAVRMLRLAPLAFDASTLELLVPLAAGHAVTVYPPRDPTPGELADFLGATTVTHAWLTSGLFHLVADHRPEAFAGLRQLFTGGGVVSPAHVRRVLARCPGLRITNGYGPTENTTFTTTFDADSVADVLDPLPIGRPVCGTEVAVVDAAGRLAPPGAVGELWTAGWGLAHGYLEDPVRTAASFTDSPVLGRRAYRTGDLVRWAADGRLRFVGRNDRQIKIAGHRVELVDVERRIKAQPGVLDAVVFLAGGPTDARLHAAVKTESLLSSVRAAVEAELATHARPRHWFTVAEFPLDRNGKVDLQALGGRAWTPTPEPSTSRSAPELSELEDLITCAWTEALGTDDFGPDEAFFDVGGDSLSIAVARRLIQQRLPGREIPLTDMYQFPTVQALAAHLHSTLGGVHA